MDERSIQGGKPMVWFCGQKSNNHTNKQQKNLQPQMLIFKLKLGMFYNATWLVSVIFVVDLRVTEFFFFSLFEWIVFIWNCIEHINTLGISGGTKSVGYRQKGLVKSASSSRDTQDIMPLLLIFYENILSKMSGT